MIRIAPVSYIQTDWQQILSEIERQLMRRQRLGSDYEIGEGRLILTSPNGTRYEVVVDNAGTLATVAL